MLTLLSALGSLLSFRVRSRLTLELELVALRHQVTVLRRQRPGRMPDEGDPRAIDRIGPRDGVDQLRRCAPVGERLCRRSRAYSMAFW